MARYRVITHLSRIEVEVQVTLQRWLVESQGLEGHIVAEHEGGRLLTDSVAGRFTLPSTSFVSGNNRFDRDMNKMLETRKYSRVTGDILSVKADDDEEGLFDVRGNLTVHGQSRDVEGSARLTELSEERLVVDSEMTLDVTDFGIEVPKLLFLTVKSEILVRGHVVAEVDG